MLPAFKHAENSESAALITGNPEKDRELSERYRVKAYTYDDLESALEKEKIDAVYIATPNILHRDYTERAAQAGVHVLCEKPIATTQDDCEATVQRRPGRVSSTGWGYYPSGGLGLILLIVLLLVLLR